ncbi:MAG: hypothetical protein WCG35_09745 [Betaproteobacteria bacterium]
MYRQHYLEAIETVLALDLPDEALADAINHQVMQDLSFYHEDVWERYPSNTMTFNH